MELHYYSALVALLALQRGHTEDSVLPDYIQPCNFTAEEFVACVKEQIEESLPQVARGAEALGLPSLDPLRLKDFTVDGGGLQLQFLQPQMHGLANVSLSQFQLWLGGANESFQLALRGNLSLTAKYNASGKILILPIEGDGDARIDCHNIEVHISSNFTHTRDDDGEEHLKLRAPRFHYDIENTAFDLKNLFNGNKKLAETTLRFANENWRGLMEDLAPPFIKQIVRTIVKTINKFFSKFPISRIIEDYAQTL